MSRSVPFLLVLVVSLLTACGGDLGLIEVHVPQAGPDAWAEACGQRVPIVDDRAVVAAPRGARCRVWAWRDDRSVRPTSQLAHVRVDGGHITRVELQLPALGRTAGPGLLLAPHPEGARVVALAHAPLAWDAPHPAWLDGAVVTAVDGLVTRDRHPHALLAMLQGPPHTRVRLRLRSPLLPGGEHHVVLRRMPPRPWPGGRPPAPLVDAWSEGAVLPGHEVAHRLAAWAQPAVALAATASPCAGTR